MSTATITSKGQITIPAAVRARLGLKAGDRVDFVFAPDGMVVLKTKKIPVERLYGMLKSRLSHVPTVEEMNEAIAEGASERYLRAIGKRRK